MSGYAAAVRSVSPILSSRDAEASIRMGLLWLEQKESDVPAGNDWLGAIEMECLQSFRFAKRRTDWRLGRWTAKHALAACLDAPSDPGALADMEILAAESGAPEVFHRGQKIDVGISLSHRAGVALCCLSRDRGGIGCDLETVEARSDAFLADFFTPKERALIQQTSEKDQSLLVALLWSAKESALKALQVGLRADTNDLEVQPVDDPAVDPDSPWPAAPGRLTRSATCDVEPADWRPIEVVATEGAVFRGWWREADGLVRTLLSLTQ